ncbi:glycogen/starch/alpha-glucan phosphorylase [Dendrosporobacter sp. 1207_IL3150]|uniref:glycogen/starch/alpha-glucan phosphorylase n=1 Tax=Dendrosporobacter sp. 1207_IL3150 TaxID=3084054 RepID=UPI002FDA40E2
MDCESGNDFSETGNSEVEKFQTMFLNKLTAVHGVCLQQASPWQQYTALAAVVRDLIGADWQQTKQLYATSETKQVYYLSIEFLLGRLLGSNLLNLGLYDVADKALSKLGICINELEQAEPDAGLGNGGLGRLAACYLDSMASGSLPGHGCGLRYKYGLFEQRFVEGMQYEYPDGWLKDGYAWEYRRPDDAVEVMFGKDEIETVLAVPYDVPIIGYQNNVVNTLRLWSAEAAIGSSACLIDGHQDCQSEIDNCNSIEAITNILYPDDSTYQGKVLRLKQQYLLVSASLKSILRDYKAQNRPVKDLDKYVAIHINDTHPALAVPELMRILLDEEHIAWDRAWSITINTLSYTNHTVLPEALEKWPVDMFKALLPRIYEIINDINEHFCHDLWLCYPGEWDKIAQMAVIADNQVHMAHLAIVGSHSVNGVAKLHTEILKTQVMKNFSDYYPIKFNNKTNGVAHRRWLIKANAALAKTITKTIGEDWLKQPAALAEFAKYADDSGLQQDIAAVKRTNKLNLAKYVWEKYDIRLSVDSIFDVQIKRIHSYKRQLLNALHIMDLYNKIKAQPNIDITPRTFIFGGKAAAGYYEAKATIKLINTIAGIINNDKLQDKLKVIFLEDYNVSLAELVIPAADVSEQISTAGKEASGTGNMKLMMNGAITIGTLDGANIEIKEAAGEDNIFIFGLTANQTTDFYKYGGYHSWDIYHSDDRIKTVMEQLVNGFMPVPKDEFSVFYSSLLHENDQYFVLKDFNAYAEAHQRLDNRFKDQAAWRRMAINNIAQSGRFAIDRTFAEYSEDIWTVNPVRPQEETNEATLDKACARDSRASILMQ